MQTFKIFILQLGNVSSNKRHLYTMGLFPLDKRHQDGPLSVSPPPLSVIILSDPVIPGIIDKGNFATLKRNAMQGFWNSGFQDKTLVLLILLRFHNTSAFVAMGLISMPQCGMNKKSRAIDSNEAGKLQKQKTNKPKRPPPSGVIQ